MKDKIINNHYFRLVVSSLFAGFIMAIGAFELVVAKSLNLFYLGGFVQGFALLTIIYLGLEIYNVKVCSIFASKTKLKTLLDIFITLVCNLLAITLVAYLLKLLTNDKKELIEAAIAIAESRVITVGDIQGKEWYDAVIASIMCGMIVSIGVNIYRRTENVFIRFLSIIVAIGVYVACGFEQIMTNTFYILFAGKMNTATFLNLVIVFIGNTLGGMLVFFIFKLLSKKVESK